MRDVKVPSPLLPIPRTPPEATPSASMIYASDRVANATSTLGAIKHRSSV
jgi:hypothetical protein